VGFRSSFSALLDVLSGVPQGSVIGSLLFLLYVNDLADWILSSIQMFANDTKLWRVKDQSKMDINRLQKDLNSLTCWRVKDQSKMDINRLQKDLNSLTCWCVKYMLKFNPQKCKVLHVGHKIDSAYYMQDTQNDCTKYKL